MVGYFYTPHGLKVRLPIQYAFSLLCRLLPSVRPEQVLYLTEALQAFPLATGKWALLFAVASRKSLGSMILLGIAGILLAQVMVSFGRFTFPGVPVVVRLLAMSAGYAFDLGLVVGAFIYTGLPGGLNAVIARVVMSAVALVLDASINLLKHKTSGSPFVTSEVCFFHAFGITARHLGVDINLELSESEKGERFWTVPLLDYASRFPNRVPADQVSRRSTASPSGCSDREELTRPPVCVLILMPSSYDS